MRKRYYYREGEKLWITVGWLWLILSVAIAGIGWTLIAFALSWFVYNTLLDIVHVFRSLVGSLWPFRESTLSKSHRIIPTTTLKTSLNHVFVTSQPNDF